VYTAACRTPATAFKPGAQLIGGRIRSTEDDVGVARAIRSGVWPEAPAARCPSRMTCESREGTAKEISMLLTLFVVLLVLWLLGFFAFHVAGGLIHILLIIAAISLVAHLFRGRSGA